jgi:hypothetical protein
MRKTNDFDEKVAAFCRHFSPEGVKALYEYLTEVEIITREEMEFDPAILLRNFTEYKDLEAIQKVHPYIKDMDDLKEHTAVVEFKSGLIIANLETL